MMKKYALALGLILSSSAMAYNTSDTIQVQVSGQIITAVCEVELDNTVSLGQIARQDLSVPGGNSAPVTFAVKLTNCSPELSKVTIAFSGTPYTADPDFSSAIYANELADGAQDVGLQLLNLDGNTLINLANGVNYTMPLIPGSGSKVLSFIARMYTPHGTPTAGDFKSAVTLNFTYE
ncbi:fimbrial protein [Kluyvera cryocrescens]|uniref:fimbrial protein n=1 Tax=Kluyvera cryocrescens TaxID=580 RepID=UPI00224B62AC|nr:fimbrial protein [Kluyvera cryocrescens]MCX2866140.1 fimbrial protein [Kluyvera cryocrescens]